MRSITNEQTSVFTHHLSNGNTYKDFLSVIRSRLNVIGTSMYLLENSLDDNNVTQRRYIEKINEELEMIRKFINE